MPRNFSTPQANTPALGAGLLTPPWAEGGLPAPGARTGKPSVGPVERNGEFRFTVNISFAVT
jgi:hypothetical protein